MAKNIADLRTLNTRQVSDVLVMPLLTCTLFDSVHL